MTLPSPWDAYMRLQSELDETTQVDNRSWGLEAGLDAVLAAAPGNVGAAVASLTTTIATAARRERHRARLRRIHSGPLWPAVDQPEAIEARVRIEQIRRMLAPADWRLISAVAMGTDYRAMGRSFRATPSSLRVRVVRIRNGLASVA
jgi:hypothetical protein